MGRWWWVGARGVPPSAMGVATRSINTVPSGTCNGRINSTSWSSPHEGGAFMLVADGAVRFLSENMDITTLRALSTKAGNEVIDDEDY